MRTRTRGLLSNMGSVEARIQLPQRSQKWECSHLSVCVGGGAVWEAQLGALAWWLQSTQLTSTLGLSVHLVSDGWCYLRYTLS